MKQKLAAEPAIEGIPNRSRIAPFNTEAGPPPCTKDYHNLAALSPEPQEPSWDTPQQLISSRTAYDSPKASETPLLKGIPSVKEP